MTTPTVRQLRRVAESCAQRGWHVFPLRPGTKWPALHGENRCPRSGPCVEGHRTWERQATTDPRLIAIAWSRVPYNVGIACGPSRLVVVDLDQPKADHKWPTEWRMDGVLDGSDVFTVLCERAGQSVPFNTRIVRTTSGGLHLYFTAPANIELRNTKGKLGPLIDTRAFGGQVLASGCQVGSGSYEVINDAEPQPLPVWLIQKLRPAPPPQSRPANIPSGSTRAAKYVNTAIEGAISVIRDAGRAGDGRKTAVFNTALTLGRLVAGGALDKDEAERVLTAEAARVGLRQTETARAIASGFRYGAERPRVVSA